MGPVVTLLSQSQTSCTVPVLPMWQWPQTKLQEFETFSRYMTTLDFSKLKLTKHAKMHVSNRIE